MTIAEKTQLQPAIVPNIRCIQANPLRSTSMWFIRLPRRRANAGSLVTIVAFGIPKIIHVEEGLRTTLQLDLRAGSQEAVSNCAISSPARAAARVRQLRPCRHKGSRPAPPVRREYASLDRSAIALVRRRLRVHSDGRGANA